MGARDKRGVKEVWTVAGVDEAGPLTGRRVWRSCRVCREGAWPGCSRGGLVGEVPRGQGEHCTKTIEGW